MFLAIPAKDLQTFTPDERILPSESPVRQGINLIEESYGIGATNPINVVIHAEDGAIISTLSQIINNFPLLRATV